MNGIVPAFKEWIRINDQLFKDNGLLYEVSESPEDIDNVSTRIDFESSNFLSRITVWSSGECFLEAININTEETVLSNLLSIGNEKDFDGVFKELLGTIFS
ncbi:MAG: hypothetical protein ABFS45_03035 [Pseudomonadota bacterium]